jgi:hydroxyacylglutathione hydrolase
MVNLEIKTLVVGPLSTNCYLVADSETKQAFILDPGAEPEKILQTLHATYYLPRAIIATHCHFDHVGAVAELKEKLNIPFLIPEEEQRILSFTRTNSKIWVGKEIKHPPNPDGFLKEDDKVKIDQIKFKVISTPGHSSGGICLYAKEAKLDAKNAKGVLFSGDTLFVGSIGRTDLPGSCQGKMKNSLKKLFQLPEKTIVYPGHGEKTTIEKERKTNPFFQNL